MCDPVTVQRYAVAPNAEVVRKRKTGEIVQINLASHGDDSALRSTPGDASPTYSEHLAVHTLLVLKRYDGETGRLVRWSDYDSFSPRRFNPDSVRTVRPEAVMREQSAVVGAKPADAPRVPAARFSVKCNPSLPWSAANSRDVF